MLNYVDETEMEEQGVGDLLLDENTTAAMPRYLKLQRQTMGKIVIIIRIV